MAETRPLYLEITPGGEDDPFEAFQLSLQRWPLFHQFHLPFMESTDYHDQSPPAELPCVCLACGDTHQTQYLLTLRCSCSFCSTCLTRLFTRAMSDEALYPPSCHQRSISLNTARRHLPPDLIRAYRLKSLELNTKFKIYCSKVDCNAFVAPHSIHNGKAFCQKCRQVTCVRCKDPEHWGPCEEGEGTLLSLIEMGQKEKWKACPDCKRLVERIDGCNHILCRCGTDFCYACGLHLEKCLCSDENEVDEEDNVEFLGRMWLARRPGHQGRPRTPTVREWEEDMIEDTMVAPFGLAEDEFSDR